MHQVTEVFGCGLEGVNRNIKLGSSFDVLVGGDGGWGSILFTKLFLIQGRTIRRKNCDIVRVESALHYW